MGWTESRKKSSRACNTSVGVAGTPQGGMKDSLSDETSVTTMNKWLLTQLPE